MGLCQKDHIMADNVENMGIRRGFIFERFKPINTEEELWERVIQFQNAVKSTHLYAKVDRVAWYDSSLSVYFTLQMDIDDPYIEKEHCSVYGNKDYKELVIKKAKELFMNDPEMHGYGTISRFSIMLENLPFAPIKEEKHTEHVQSTGRPKSASSRGRPYRRRRGYW